MTPAPVRLRQTGLTSSQFAANLFDAEKVSVLPADAFGQSAKGHIRLTLTVPNDVARSQPDAISFEVFEELVNESNQLPLKIELTGIVKDGTLQLRMAEPVKVPLQVQENEIFVNNLQLVIQLQEGQ